MINFFLSHIAEDLIKKLIDTFTWCEWSESAGMAALSPGPGRVRSHTKIFFLINDLPCYLSLTRALAGLIICMESRHYQDGMGANLKRYHIYICIKNISGRSRPTHAPHTQFLVRLICVQLWISAAGPCVGTWHVARVTPSPVSADSYIPRHSCWYAATTTKIVPSVRRSCDRVTTEIMFPSSPHIPKHIFLARA